MTRDEAAAAIGAAWNQWLLTTDHRYKCIGENEGCACCVEARPDGFDTSSSYGFRQDVLIGLALDALGVTS